MRCAGPSRGSPLPDLEPPRLAVHPPHLRPGVAPETDSPPVVGFLQHPPGEFVDDGAHEIIVIQSQVRRGIPIATIGLRSTWSRTYLRGGARHLHEVGIWQLGSGVVVEITQSGVLSIGQSITWMHDSPHGGHVGKNHTLQDSLGRRAEWLLRLWLQPCDGGQRSRAPRSS